MQTIRPVPARSAKDDPSKLSRCSRNPLDQPNQAALETVCRVLMNNVPRSHLVKLADRRRQFLFGSRYVATLDRLPHATNLRPQGAANRSVAEASRVVLAKVFLGTG